jgi:N-acyl-D-amino-acid deacylase
MGWDARFAEPEEISEMKRMLKDSLNAGSLGLSLGLYYCPGIFSHTNELMELASVLTEFGAPLVPHTRGLSATYDKAIEEVITVAEKNKIPLHISHHAGGSGQVRRRALKIIEEAKERGMKIGHDNMPWAGGCTAILAHLPPWMLDGGINNLLERLQNSDLRKQAIDELESFQPKWPTWENKYWTDKFFGGNTYIGGFKLEENQKYEYMQIKNIAKKRNQNMYDALFDLIIEEKGSLFTLGYIDHPLAEKLYDDLIKDPDCSIETDVIGVDFKNPFPVSYGTFTKVLGEMARDKGLMSQEEAIRKMTSLPADQMQINDRGLIKEGCYADITIFNPEKVNSKVSFKTPFQNSEGIEYVIINGQVVLDQGNYNPKAFAGKVLRRTD